jgi:hypothetical protein
VNRRELFAFLAAGVVGAVALPVVFEEERPSVYGFGGWPAKNFSPDVGISLCSISHEQMWAEMGRRHHEALKRSMAQTRDEHLNRYFAGPLWRVIP